MRHLDHRREIKMFDGCANPTGWTGRWLFLPKIGIHLVELPHLSVGSPAQVTITGLPHIKMGNVLKSARRMEARGQFVSERLVLHKTIFARRPDCLLV